MDNNEEEKDRRSSGECDMRERDHVSRNVGNESPAVVPFSSILIPSTSFSLSGEGDRKDSSNSSAGSLGKGTTLLCYRMSDVAVSILILLPLTIGIWRGIWQIMDAYSGPWVSILLGNSLSFLLYFFQEELKGSVHPRKMHFLSFYIVSRTLLLAHAFASINQWRGLWVLWDNETMKGDESTSAITSFVIGTGLLMLIKSFCNVSATPLFVGVDEAGSVHDCTLRFKTPAESKCLYFLDCIWSVIIVQNLVVTAWRGVWNLADIHLYPQHKALSAVVSLGIGITIVILLSILQPCYFRFMIKLKCCMRLAVFHVVTMWSFIGCVLAWRGNWHIYDNFIVFETPLMSEWLTLGVGTAGAILLGALSTVTTRGVSVDGEDSGDGTTEWPFSYISFLQKKRHHNIPFAEPWLFRYLCTSQRICPTECSTQRRTISHDNESQINQQTCKLQEGTHSVTVTDALFNASKGQTTTLRKDDDISNCNTGDKDNENNIC